MLFAALSSISTTVYTVHILRSFYGGCSVCVAVSTWGRRGGTCLRLGLILAQTIFLYRDPNGSLAHSCAKSDSTTSVTRVSTIFLQVYAREPGFRDGLPRRRAAGAG